MVRRERFVTFVTRTREPKAVPPKYRFEGPKRSLGKKEEMSCVMAWTEGTTPGPRVFGQLPQERG